MVKNAPGQSINDIRLAIVHKKLDQSAWFVACWDRLNEDKSWFDAFYLVRSKRPLKQPDFWHADFD